MAGINTLEERFFPFYRLGLRRNPFGALTDEEWQAITVIPPVMDDLLRHNDRYLQFTGKAGCGKTTLLLSVRQHLMHRGERIVFEKLLEGQRRFSTSLDRLDGLALDEAQRLGWLERRRLFREIGERRLLITTHEDLSGWFHRYGKSLVTLSAAECITREHLANMLHCRLAFFAHEDKPGVSFTPDSIDFLYRVFGTNLRGVEHFLYEVFQNLPGPGMLTERSLAMAAK